MRLALRDDKRRVIEILQKAYVANPSVLWLVKPGKNVEKRIAHLCDYCFESGMLLNAVYITRAENGVCVFYPMENKKFSFREVFLQLKLIHRVIGWARLPEILRRERYIKKNRADEPCIYFFMLAVLPGTDQGAGAREMRDQSYAYARERNLPIYAETSVPLNKKIYERFGFETYHEWKVPGKDFTTWFMRKYPETQERLPQPKQGI